MIEKLDHKNLNLDVPEFMDTNPTAENIAIVIYNILRNKIDERIWIYRFACTKHQEILWSILHHDFIIF